MTAFIVTAPLVIIVVAILIGLNISAAAYVGNLLDTLVLNKLSTASGVERSSWNSQGIQNFIDTYGFRRWQWQHEDIQFSHRRHR